MRLPQLVVAALATFTLAVAPAAAASPMESQSSDTGASIASFSKTWRIHGSSRIETAVEMSLGTWNRKEGDDQVRAVVLSRSDSFADALAGGPLAGVARGPLLLTASTSLPAATRNEITRVLGGQGNTVYLLGGTGSISAGVEKTLRDAGYEVIRLAGANRFETAVRVAEEIERLQGAPVRDVVLTTGMNFPDGLAAGAAAGSVGIPLLLTQDDRLPAATAAFLRHRKLTTTTAVGGQAAAAGEWTHELVGRDRHLTAARVCQHYFGAQGSFVVGVATGENWPDALAGSAMMAAYGAPLLLARQNELTAATADSVRQLRTHPRRPVEVPMLFGGPSVVSDRVASQLDGLFR